MNEIPEVPVDWLERTRARDREIILLMWELQEEDVRAAFDNSSDLWEFRDALRRLRDENQN